MEKQKEENRINGSKGWRWLKVDGRVVKRIVVIAGEMAFVLPKDRFFNGRVKRALVVSSGQVFKTQADAVGGPDREVYLVRGHGTTLHHEKVKVRGSGELNDQHYQIVTADGSLRSAYGALFDKESQAIKHITDELRREAKEHRGEARKYEEAAADLRNPKRKRARRRR